MKIVDNDYKIITTNIKILLIFLPLSLVSLEKLLGNKRNLA